LTNACEGNPDYWFSENPAEIDHAKQACGFCPVRAECAEIGEDEEFGVWGGQSPEERRAAKRFRVVLIEEWTNSKINSMRADNMSISAMSRELGIPRKTLADRLRRMTGLVA
jgi:transcriptional regulator of acetoin/glycerol metabolism